VILVGLGGNLPSPEHGPPIRSLSAALKSLAARGVVPVRRSRWYETAPVPASDQPWFVNAVVSVETALDPAALLTLLHAVESEFGRIRGAPNAARLIDLDLLDYHGRVDTGWPVLPHPRLTERAFVLRPLLDVAPQWRHPVSGLEATALLAALGDGQEIRLAGEARLP